MSTSTSQNLCTSVKHTLKIKHFCACCAKVRKFLAERFHIQHGAERLVEIIQGQSR